jgi:hypothetical protein
MAVVKGKTKTGFEFELGTELIDDYEVLEMYEDIKETGLGVRKLLTRLIGEDGYNRLKEHCRKKDGTISAKRIGHEMNDIMSTNVGDTEPKN